VLSRTPPGPPLPLCWHPFYSFRAVHTPTLPLSTPEAIQDLRYAVIQQGFCYLDLRGQEIQHTLEDVNDCVAMAKEFYALPTEEKLKYDIDELSPHKING
jgi:isopenicillin N synthase-like dioxygenase